MKAPLICVILALSMTGSFAALYTFNNSAGGSWQTATNWSPEGIPGASDDVQFVYIDNMPSQVDLTLDGEVTVNSLTVEHYSYMFKSGSLVVQNSCLLNAGWLIKINITLNGDSVFESTGSGEAGVACDGCVMNVKKSLTFKSRLSGNMQLANNARLINYAGANTTIVYGALRVSDQVGTLINYGTLTFQSVLATYPKTPYGDPPVAETGAWKALQNYGEIRIQVDDSPTGVPVYNDIRTWDFSSGKMTLLMVQESTANEQGVFDPNYEYNDAISSGGQHDYYECTIGGDVHIVFAQAEVKPGETERPFDPKVGDFFPVFANFHKITGKFNTVTSEGLSSSLALGRMSMKDPSTQLYHSGVVICASSDTACINSSGGALSPGSPTSISSANLIEISFMALLAFVSSLF
jgi:hypothetical protein